MKTNEQTNIDSESFREFLREELVRRCKEDSQYSLRSFAKDLSIDNSALSKILSGKRALGKNLIKKLLPSLKLAPRDLSKFIIKEVDPDKIAYEKLALDSFIIISDWYHYAILELLRLDHYESNSKWIANALGININECNAAIERLIRVDLVERLDDGTLIDVSGGKSTNISNEMKHGAFKKLQIELLEKAMKNINSVPIEKRNNTSMTMAIDTELLPIAIDEITLFRRKMGQLLSRGNKRNEVYNLSISLSPLSNIDL